MATGMGPKLCMRSKVEMGQYWRRSQQMDKGRKAVSLLATPSERSVLFYEISKRSGNVSEVVDEATKIGT